jgi:hypothetical protein
MNPRDIHRPWRLCAPRIRRPALKETADPATVIRDRIAQVEGVRRAYQRALDGDKPTRLKPEVLRENIARTTRRLAELRAELGSLQP